MKESYVYWSSIFNSEPYYRAEVMEKILKKAGFENVHLEPQNGWFNQPDVVVFTGDEDRAKKVLEERGDEIHPLVRKWGVIIRDKQKDWSES